MREMCAPGLFYLERDPVNEKENKIAGAWSTPVTIVRLN